MKQKIVYDITKFTTTDYANHLSCIVWFVGCNLRCKYCYNDKLVFSKIGQYSLEDVLNFLKERVGLLDAVVLSGGESTVHNLILFCKKIKRLGYKIKLDTNGLNLIQIKKLINLKLIDYIALDMKAPSYKYSLITEKSFYDIWVETIKYLIEIDFDFEVRTTVNSDLLDENDINFCIKILEDLSYKNNYYLQNFLQTSSNIANIQETKKINKEKIFTQKLKLIWRNL